MMNSIRIKLVGHVARMREMRNVYNVLVGKCQRRDHLEGLDVEGKIIL